MLARFRSEAETIPAWIEQFFAVWTKHGSKQSLVISKPDHTHSYRSTRATIQNPLPQPPKKLMAGGRLDRNPYELWQYFPKTREREMKFWYQFTVSGGLRSALVSHIYVTSSPCCALSYKRTGKAYHARYDRKSVLYLWVPIFPIEWNILLGILYEISISIQP